MSLWDLYDQNDIHSLLTNTESPDLNAILSHSELFQLYRENDKDLIDFLNNPQIFQKILQIMTKGKETKISKLVVELFLFKDSILLKKLFSDQKTTKNLIQSISNVNESKNDETISLSKEDRLVKIGYISRIFIHSLSIPEYKQTILSLFSSVPTILATLSQNVDVTSIMDFLQTYLNLLKPEDQWILFAYVQILLPKGKSASCPKCFLKYKSLIITIITEMAKVSPLNNEIKANLLRLISNTLKNSIEVEKNSNADVINVISTNLSFIFESTESDEEMKVLILRLAMIIPPERSLLNIAAKLIKNSSSTQFNSVNVAALDLLSVSPSKTLSVLLPIIIKNFVNDKTNSFHHLSFLNFITNAIEKVPELRGPIAKEMCPLIISESSGSDKWRKNAQRVGFFLEIAESIDQYVDELASSGTVDKSTFSAWKNFRNADLKKWKLKDSEKVDAPEAVAMSSSASNTAKKPSSLAAAVAAEEEAALNKAKEQSERPNKDSNSKEEEKNAASFGFGDGFPPADSFPKEESNTDENKENGGFGGFGFGDGFPPVDSFPKDEKEDDNKGFGGFENAFPSADAFPKEKNDDNKGFGGFENAFPSADAFPKEKNDDDDKGFGGFENAFPADAFPKEEPNNDKEKGNNSGFGGFGFGDGFPPVDSFPKEEKEDDKGFGGFGNAFPTADSVSKEEPTIHKANNGFGSFDNAFPSPDAFPKEEKEDDKGFGGFGNAFPSADSFQKEEPTTTDKGFGGFDNAFPAADSFPKEDKNDGGFGGFTAAEHEDTKKKNDDAKFGSSTADDADQANKNSNDEEEDKKDDDDDDDDDDSDFEDLSGQPTKTENKPVISRPAPIPSFSQPKPASNEPVDVSFNHFLELIDNPCWTYTGPTPAELFGQKDAYSTAEEAFNFLVGNNM